MFNVTVILSKPLDIDKYTAGLRYITSLDGKTVTFHSDRPIYTDNQVYNATLRALKGLKPNLSPTEQKAIAANTQGVQLGPQTPSLFVSMAIQQELETLAHATDQSIWEQKFSARKHYMMRQRSAIRALLKQQHSSPTNPAKAPNRSGYVDLFKMQNEI